MPRPSRPPDPARAARPPAAAVAGVAAAAVLLGALATAWPVAGDEAPRSNIQSASEAAATAAVAPHAGLTTSRAPDVLREQLALPPGTGLVVETAPPESAAGRAGLRRHDVLVALDEQPLGTPEQLLALLASAPAGTPLVLDIRRAGHALAVPLRPVAAPVAVPAPVTAAVPAAPVAAPVTIGTAIAVPPPALPAPPPPAALPSPPAASAAPRDVPPVALPGARRIGPDAVVLEARDCRLKVYRDGDTHLSMCDSRGWLVFNGPISTPAQRSLIPRRVRDRVERLEEMLDTAIAPPGSVTTDTPPAGTTAATPPAGPAATPRPAPPPVVAPVTPPDEPVAEIGRLDVPPIEIR